MLTYYSSTMVGVEHHLLLITAFHHRSRPQTQNLSYPGVYLQATFIFVVVEVSSFDRFVPSLSPSGHTVMSSHHYKAFST
jgi:hypothetical protein